METVLRVFGAAYLIMAVVGAIWTIPTALHAAGLLFFFGLVLLAFGELLTRIGRGGKQ